VGRAAAEVHAGAARAGLHGSVAGASVPDGPSLHMGGALMTGRDYLLCVVVSAVCVALVILALSWKPPAGAACRSRYAPPPPSCPGPAGTRR
jgi:hypothetical protein